MSLAPEAIEEGVRGDSKRRKRREQRGGKEHVGVILRVINMAALSP